MMKKEEKIDLLLTVSMTIIVWVSLFNHNSTVTFLDNLLFPLLLIASLYVNDYKCRFNYEILVPVSFILFFILLLINHFWTIGYFVYFPFTVLFFACSFDEMLNFWEKKKGGK